MTESLFPNVKPVIGMIHAGALPGTPASRLSIAELIELATREARIYRAGGVDALMVENTHDTPYVRVRVGPDHAQLLHAIEPEIAENLSKITTIICVMLDWNETRRAFVRRLAEQGAGVKVIIVRDGPCAMDPNIEGDSVGAIPVISSKDGESLVEEL